MEREVHPMLAPLRAADEVAFVCDEAGEILDVTESVGALLGRSRASLRGTPLASLAAPGAAETARRGLAEARRRGTARFSLTLGGSPPVEAAMAAWSMDLLGTSVTLCLAAPSDARREAEERARRLADTQKVISTILELAVQDVPLDELLQRTLDLVLWIPWLSIEQKGAIFLVEEDPERLVMKAARSVNTALFTACAQVPFDRCLCGLAARRRQPVYAADVDERHTTRYQGMTPHGHYCVPICSGEATLGVICTYLAAGHEASAIDLEFLLAVADTLAGVLLRRRAHDELARLRDEVCALRRRELDGARASDEVREQLELLLASAQDLAREAPTQDQRGHPAVEAMERAARRALAAQRRWGDGGA